MPAAADEVIEPFVCVLCGDAKHKSGVADGADGEGEKSPAYMLYS